MSWKSTIDITREEAIQALAEQILNHKTNKELEDMLEHYKFGEDACLKWYGHNFIVIDEEKLKNI